MIALLYVNDLTSRLLLNVVDESALPDRVRGLLERVTSGPALPEGVGRAPCASDEVFAPGATGAFQCRGKSRGREK